MMTEKGKQAKRDYMRAYMKEYLKRPGKREQHLQYQADWKKRNPEKVQSNSDNYWDRVAKQAE